MNIFLLIGIFTLLFVSISVLEEFLKHHKLMKAYEGKNIARVEDYGYKDHYLLKRLWKSFSSILVVLIAFGLYFSIIIIFLQSINSSSIVTSWSGATFKWYLNMFSNKSFNNAIIHTFTVSILATIISTVLGTLIAVGLFYSSKRIREHILLLNNFPILNADIVTGISLMLIFSSLITIDPYFFGLKTMLLAHIYFCIPYVILNVLNKMKDLSQNVVDASFDLGLNPFKTLIRVILPALKSGIFAGAILAFTMSYDDFVISYYTTGNGYDNLSIWIYSSMGRKSLSPVVYAFSIIVIIVCLLVLIASLFIHKKKGAKK